MRIISFSISMVMGLLALSSCSSVRILSTHQMEGVDFAGFRTYEFMDDQEEGAIIPPPEAVLALTRAISGELDRRSLTPASQADLRINLGLWVEKKVQTRETSIVESPPYYTGQRRYYWESTEVQVGTYKEGYVTVDIVDAERNELVWQGVAAGTVASNPAKNEARIQKAMGKLFKKFPVKALE